MLMYCVDEQTVKLEHSLSVVGVRLVEMYCSDVHVFAVAHTRFEVDVGSLVWYSLDVQSVMVLHTRSDVAVLPVASYCVLMSHAVSDWQTRSDDSVASVC